MTNKHRWYDVIVAWANGEKIQVRGNSISEWVDFILDNPCFDGTSWEWRIKPKKVTQKYRLALVNAHLGTKEVCAVDVTNSSIDYPIEYDIDGFIRWIGDTVEVEIESDA